MVFVAVMLASFQIGFGKQTPEVGMVKGKSERAVSLSRKERKINDSLKLLFINTVAKGDIDHAKKLLSEGVNANSVDSMGISVLLTAVTQNRAELVRVLVEHGANVSCCDTKGTTPLMQVIANGNKPIPKRMDDGTVVHITPKGSYNESLFDFLVSSGADFDATDALDETVLVKAASCGNKEAVKAIIELKPDLNAPDRLGRTALVHAVTKQHISIAEALAVAGADLNFADESGQTPLIHAVQTRNLQLVTLLLDKGVNLQRLDHSGTDAKSLAEALHEPKIASLIKNKEAKQAVH